MTDVPLCDRLAWSIPEFCQLCGISEPLYYKLQRLGQGPRKTKLGARTVITREDGQEWLRKRTKEVAA